MLTSTVGRDGANCVVLYCPGHLYLFDEFLDKDNIGTVNCELVF